MDINFQISPEQVLIFGTLGMLMLTIAVVVFILLYQRKLSKRKMEFELIQQAFKKQELETAYAMLQAQDDERQRIAEDLHDNLGSTLSALTMFSSSLLTSHTHQVNQDTITRLNSLAQKAHAEVRQISHQLDSSLIKHFGLEAAIIELTNTINSSGKIKVDLICNLPHAIDYHTGQNLYRITQELFTNTLKYARASTVTLSLHQKNDNLLIYSYQDNGIGIVSTAMNGSGMGLRNIHSRLEKMNASLHIAPSHHKGYSFSFEVPFHTITTDLKTT